MGMDVYGTEPANSKGEYFRASIWGWPNITTVMEACGYDVPMSWYHNDGEGLGCQEDCDHLANMMDGYLSEGVLTFAPVCTTFGAKVSNAILDGVLDKIADLPEGAKNSAKRVETNDVKPINVEFVQEFIIFLRACGGFTIC